MAQVVRTRALPGLGIKGVRVTLGADHFRASPALLVAPSHSPDGPPFHSIRSTFTGDPSYPSA